MGLNAAPGGERKAPTNPIRKIGLDESALRAFEKAAAGKPESAFRTRNRVIIVGVKNHQPLDVICETAQTNKPVIWWVVKRAQRGEWSRLVENRQRVGRPSKRKEILTLLSDGRDEKEILTATKVHPTTLWRALHGLKGLKRSA